MASSDGVVSVCIPAYMAEGFIERTLSCAVEQTYEAQRILVSIDRSADGTEEICRSFARADDRIEVKAHDEQLGWVGNVNFLLDWVSSEFGFVYFHDDIVETTYSEMLVRALRERPDAASAHCDVLLDGGNGGRLRRGCAYDGTAAQRLLRYLVGPNRGALLRSMVRRSSPAADLRMTVAGAHYEMALVAAGPVVHVDEPLYRRWIERPGGLTDAMAQRPFDAFVDGARLNGTFAEDVIEELRPSADEGELLRFGLAVYMTDRLRTLETSHQATRLVGLDEVLSSPASLQVPVAAERLSEELRELCIAGSARAERRTAARAQQLGRAVPRAGSASRTSRR